jgi:lipopolysaccharide/colanic/teichoic acid biosynthesis glycosyltransferase
LLADSRHSQTLEMGRADEATLPRRIAVPQAADVPVHSPDVQMPRFEARQAQRAEPPATMLALKRTVDLVGATLLLVVLAPVLFAIALLIRLDSPGPIIFRQARVGRDGKVFQMWKFRTMIRDADAQKLQILHLNEAAEGLFKITNDPRTTRFGRLLRSTSLDELPQLVHVVSGKMSLVGPRPLVPEEDAKIAEPYRDRLSARPGMTGAWQISGASSIPLDEMAQLDRDYLHNWSLWLDLKVIAATALLVLGRRGV